MSAESTLLRAAGLAFVRSPAAWAVVAGLATLAVLGTWFEASERWWADLSSSTARDLGLLGGVLGSGLWIGRQRAILAVLPGVRARTAATVVLATCGLGAAYLATWPQAFGAAEAGGWSWGRAWPTLVLALRTAGWAVLLYRVFPCSWPIPWLAIVLLPGWPPMADLFEPLWPAWSFADPDGLAETAALSLGTALVALAACAPWTDRPVRLHRDPAANRSSD